MTDYSWIKPNVRALIKPLGQEVTILSEPFVGGMLHDNYVCEHDQMPEDSIGVYCVHLEPIKDDDIEYPDWNEISKPREVEAL